VADTGFKMPDAKRQKSVCVDDVTRKQLPVLTAHQCRSMRLYRCKKTSAVRLKLEMRSARRSDVAAVREVEGNAQVHSAATLK
jgi:hypothetical protein